MERLLERLPRKPYSALTRYALTTLFVLGALLVMMVMRLTSALQGYMSLLLHEAPAGGLPASIPTRPRCSAGKLWDTITVSRSGSRVNSAGVLVTISPSALTDRGLEVRSDTCLALCRCKTSGFGKPNLRCVTQARSCQKVPGKMT